MSKINGWDERDYKLWSEIQSLPSYGIIAGCPDNPMLSRKDVFKLLEKAAEERARIDVRFKEKKEEPNIADMDPKI